MRSRSAVSVLLFALLAASCGSGHRHHHVSAPVQQPRLVSILLEVYDPVTNFALEGVSVRVVESEQEWSGCTCVSPYLDWYETGPAGRLLLDEYVLADAAVGFLVDGYGAAVLSPDPHEDEAWVLLELDAIGYAPIYVEVPLRWDTPDVFVEVPFE